MFEINKKMKCHFLNNSDYKLPLDNILSLRTDIVYDLRNLGVRTDFLIPIFTINDYCNYFLCISYEVDEKTPINNIIHDIENIINPKICDINNYALTLDFLYENDHEHDRIRHDVYKTFVLNILKKCLKTCKDIKIAIFNKYYSIEEFINFKINELLYDITTDMRYKYSARKIQRIWRDHITNPNYNICKRRLLNEFNSIS
jgi:hypothetical protein